MPREFEAFELNNAQNQLPLALRAKYAFSYLFRFGANVGRHHR